jgi:inner membrane protease subunit 1
MFRFLLSLKGFERWKESFINHYLPMMELPMLKQFAISFGKFYVVIHLATNYGMDLTSTLGPSMLPTLNSSGDILLVDKRLNLTLYQNQLCKGDVVVCQSPIDPTLTVCKRIVGMEGDVICGQPIPIGKLWLEGDNRQNSTDSRQYGAVPHSLVNGRVLFRLWPLFQAGKLNSL